MSKMCACLLMAKGLNHTDISSEMLHGDIHTLFYGKLRIKWCVRILRIMDMNYRKTSPIDRRSESTIKKMKRKTRNQLTKH